MSAIRFRGGVILQVSCYTLLMRIPTSMATVLLSTPHGTPFRVYRKVGADKIKPGLTWERQVESLIASSAYQKWPTTNPWYNKKRDFTVFNEKHIWRKTRSRTDLKFERRPRSLSKTHRYRVSLLYPSVTHCKQGFELSWGKLRREPATRWFDESFAPILGSGGNDLHVSSAQRKLPPSFHLASPCPSIVHHLSGLN